MNITILGKPNVWEEVDKESAEMYKKLDSQIHDLRMVIATLKSHQEDLISKTRKPFYDEANEKGRLPV